MMSAVELQARVRDVLVRAGVGPAQAVGVACSGGPDSAVLGHALMALVARDQVGRLVLVHVDHGLRPDSAQDAEVVRELARSYAGPAAARVTVVAEKVVVDRERSSLERAAREARYQVLDQVLARLGLDRMLLAHTASDQAETVLMRMIRGTGVVGLAAIPEARGPYLRPMLAISRAAVERYVAETEIPTVEDPTNRDHRFFRNRVRHVWLPALRDENPHIERALCAIAGSAAREREVLDFAATALLDQARVRGHDTERGPDAWRVDVLVRAPEAVVRRALVVAAERAGGDGLAAVHVRALEALLQGPARGTRCLDLPGLEAVREYDVLRFSRPTRDRDPASAADRLARVQVQVEGADGPYQVRSYRAGDRMRPARLRGRSRKLSDLYIDAKVPRLHRASALVVTRASDGEVVWAEHVGAAHGVDVRVTLTAPGARAKDRLHESVEPS